MATNHTTNYQLNLWEAQDTFLRTEFNENSQKLDAALKAEADARAAGDAALQTAVAAKADASTVTALTQTVNGKASTAAMNTALAQKADTSAVNTAVSTLNAAIAQKADAASQLQLVTGSYTGTGRYGASSPCAINIPNAAHPPRFVVVQLEDGFYRARMIRGSAKVDTFCWDGYSHSVDVTWTDTGVSWYSTSNSEVQLNASGKKYYYAVFI